MDSANYNNPREKLFIHIDKPYYRLRDTLWLKGYILTAFDQALNDSSKIACIEIIDAAGFGLLLPAGGSYLQEAG